MVGTIIIRFRNKWILQFVVTGLLAIFCHIKTNAQEMPPRPIGVSILQNLSFGAFSHGLTGGAVSISSFGSRSATGDIILVGMGYPYFPAIFTLEGNPGSIVHFLPGPVSTLTGSNGGFLTLQIGDCSAGDPIIINVAPPGLMQIRVGGVLIVGSPLANPPGSYTGSFMVMFIQE